MGSRSFDFTAFYYDALLAALQANRRRVLKELNDFNDYSPEVQLERMMALVGHIINVNLDILANELFLPSARLLQSIINTGNTLGFPFTQSTPATVDVVGSLADAISTPTVVVPARNKFSATLPDGSGTVPFENLDPVIVSDNQTVLIYYYSSNLEEFFTAPYVEAKVPGDCIYFGNEVMACAWALTLLSNATQLNGRWEYYDGISKQWEPITVSADTSEELSTSGDLSFHLPQLLNSDWSECSVNGSVRYWIRFLVTGVGAMPVLPVFDTVEASTFYVKFQAVEGETVEGNFVSNGFANQAFSLAQQGLVEGALQYLYIKEGLAEDEWSVVKTLALSGPAERVFKYVVDADGNITVMLGDGNNGKIPRSGATIRIPYRVLPLSLNGNVPARTIQDSSGNGRVLGCTNPRTASGFLAAFGDMEILREQIPEWVKTASKVVSPSDILFYLLNSATSSGGSPIARAVITDEGFGAKTVMAHVVGGSGAYLDASVLEAIESNFNAKYEGKLVVNKQLGVFNYQRRVLSIQATVWGGDRVDIVNALIEALNPLSQKTLEDDSVAWRWEFGGFLDRSFIVSVIRDRVGVSNVILSQPSTDLFLEANELPWLSAENVNITILEP